MRRLSALEQDWFRSMAMKKLQSALIVKQPGHPAAWEVNNGPGAGSLEVNVIFTDPKATAAALQAAKSFARELGACIRLRAGIVVPLRLGIDQTPVSIGFMEKVLSDLVGHPDLDSPELTGHLYVCRDWLDSLLRLLTPNSLVVIGGRKRWWRTAASGMAVALRAKGHRVVFIDVKSRTVGNSI
jgi:hypothetical protein